MARLTAPGGFMRPQARSGLREEWDRGDHDLDITGLRLSCPRPRRRDSNYYVAGILLGMEDIFLHNDCRYQQVLRGRPKFRGGSPVLGSGRWLETSPGRNGGRGTTRRSSATGPLHAPRASRSGTNPHRSPRRRRDRDLVDAVIQASTLGFAASPRCEPPVPEPLLCSRKRYRRAVLPASRRGPKPTLPWG